MTPVFHLRVLRRPLRCRGSLRSAPAALLLALALLCPAAALAQELPAVLIQQGERYLAMGKYQAALARYAKVLECCEGTANAAEAHNDMGVAWMRLGDAEKARKHYEAALRIDRYPLALFNYARLLEQRWKAEKNDADRSMALGYYEEFSKYLESDALMPPAVEYQKDELREAVRSALAGLAGK
ncbi:tetratricopeptide repeat protein [Paucidesulfovibrio longus]|uniref:tetratricopeptide repeat protein n=1 Tax=Paucidesulfovibrio longus TaxID=889 RepID=UPI0003B7A50A|nr:tetratricopeptide repeat protein [Paucidesulfovibrio longus]